MTQELKQLKTNDLIFIDIETVREELELNENSPKWKDFRWKMRDRETNSLPYVEQTKELYRDRAALYPTYSKIVCVTCGVIRNNKCYLKTFSGEEKDILNNLVTTIQSNPNHTQVYWNAAFDLPRIRQRYFLNGLQSYLSNNLGNDSMKKPWTLKGVLDLMEVWRGISFYNDSMSEVAVSLGLQSPKDDMNGFEVSQFYYEGKLDKIITYNQKDVVTLINIFRRFVGGDAIEDVEIVTESQKHNQEQELPPLLQKTFNVGHLTQEDEELLLSKSKKSSKLEKARLADILQAIYGKQELDEQFLNQLTN